MNFYVNWNQQQRMKHGQKITTAEMHRKIHISPSKFQLILEMM